MADDGGQINLDMDHGGGQTGCFVDWSLDTPGSERPNVSRETFDDDGPAVVRHYKFKERAVPRTYRVGVIGFAHMHVNELMRVFGAEPGIEWVACADTVPEVAEETEATFTRAWNLKYAQREIGIPKAYGSYEACGVE